MKRAISVITIIGILALGVILGGRILKMEKPKPAGGHGGHEETAHDEHGPDGHEETAHDQHGRDEHGEEHAGHVELTTAQVLNAGIEIAEAGGASIDLGLKLYGRIEANQDRMARVVARFPGIVEEVRKRLGDSVEDGEVLAVVESNESLRPYDVKSQIDGTVTAKNVTVGEFVSESTTLYTVADLSTVWVDLNVYRQDFKKLRMGQKVIVDTGEGSTTIETTIAYLSPFGAENTQSMLARAVAPNSDGLLRPGLFVTAKVILEDVDVDVAVKPEAMQTLDGHEVVFVQEDEHHFEARPVTPGRRNDSWIEVKSGLVPGDRYVARNSFMLKAEIGKGTAKHSH